MSTSSETAPLSEDATKNADSNPAGSVNGAFPALSKEEDELVEKEIRDRFKKMCEGYFDSVSKKLVIEHNVSSPSRGVQLVDVSRRGCKSRTGRTMKHTFARAKSLRIVSKHMRR